MRTKVVLLVVVLCLSPSTVRAEAPDTEKILGVLGEILNRLDELKDENRQLRQQVAHLETRFDFPAEPQVDALAKAMNRPAASLSEPQLIRASLITNVELSSFRDWSVTDLGRPSAPTDLTNEDRRLRRDLVARLDPRAAAPPGLQIGAGASPEQRGSLAAEIADEVHARMPEGVRKYVSFNANVGPSSPGGDLSYGGQGRFFLPFASRHALQAQGEFLHYPNRDEAQFDIGLVNRWGRLQASGFGSFKSVNLGQFERSGSLGQAAFNLDYIFNRGRIGFVGAKGFVDGAVVNRRHIAPSMIEETYLKVVDQVGLSTAIAAWGPAWLEGNFGAMFRRGGSNKPGGTIRYVHPLNNKVALTLEAGLNETLISDSSDGRFVVGLQFGGWLSPARFEDVGESPVPVDVPRIRYEVLRRQVRKGNQAPVADAGHDQVCTEAGVATLDGSGSFDNDGDPLTYEWVQVGGPEVALSSPNSEITTFTAAEGLTYQFRLEVSDGREIDRDRVAVAACEQSAAAVRIFTFLASPHTIIPGEPAQLTWTTEGAEKLTIESDAGAPEDVTGELGLTIKPDRTTTYTLTASGKDASETTAQVTVTVAERVIIHDFTATPAEIENPGDKVTLTWRVSNAVRGVVITGIEEPLAEEGSMDVYPTGDISYTLLAYGVDSEISAVVVVHVRNPVNRKPVAVAGPDFAAKKRWIQLDGGGSSDPDGDSIKFNWRVVAPNHNAFIRDPQAASPRVMIKGPKGKYVFELTVIDEKGAICIDSVIVAFGH